MECPFVPGDEVVCVDARDAAELVEGQCYVIERIVAFGDEIMCHDGVVSLVLTPGFAVWVFGGDDFRDPNQDSSGYRPSRFRKVQKPKTDLSIEAFLTIKPGQFEEPRKVVTPQREKEETNAR